MSRELVNESIKEIQFKIKTDHKAIVARKPYIIFQSIISNLTANSSESDDDKEIA